MVTPALMADLTGLTIFGSSNLIKDLSGLEHATNLRRLSFVNQTAKRDLTPLAGLAHLHSVQLDGRNVALETLQTLPSLTQLFITHDADLTDMTVVSQLTSLQRLDLDFNPDLRDLSGVENLEDLRHLSLVGSFRASHHEAENLTAANALSDISSLSGLENLEYLSLDYNGISDVSPLSALANLQELYLRFNNVSDVSPLSGLTGLTKLALNGNPVENAHVLYPLTQQTPPVDIIDIDVPADVDARPTVTEIRWPASFVEFGDGLEYRTLPGSARNVSGQITFSEDVTDFESDDIQLLGTATTVAIESVESVNGSGSNYTLTITITPTTDGTGDGTLGIHIPEGAVQDVSGGNDNIAYSTGDNAAAILFGPMLEIVVPEEPQNGSFDVVFEFNEPVTGLTRNWVNNYFRSAMNPIGGTLTDWNENANGTVYTLPPLHRRVMVFFPFFDSLLIKYWRKIRGFKSVYPALFTPHCHSGFDPLTVTEIRWPASFVDLGVDSNIIRPPESARNISVQITFSEDVTDFEPGDIQLLVQQLSLKLTVWKV